MEVAVVSQSVEVRIPSALLSRTGHRRSVSVNGDTIRDVINALDQQYPGLRFNVLHETGDLRPFVNIFLGAEDVRWLHGLDTPVNPGEVVHIFHSVAGGGL
jgi:molybdopterin converting factor small subunit